MIKHVLKYIFSIFLSRSVSLYTYVWLRVMFFFLDGDKSKQAFGGQILVST